MRTRKSAERRPPWALLAAASFILSAGKANEPLVFVVQAEPASAESFSEAAAPFDRVAVLVSHPLSAFAPTLLWAMHAALGDTWKLQVPSNVPRMIRLISHGMPHVMFPPHVPSDVL